MFVYTRAYFKKLIQDIKTVGYVFNIISPLIYLSYLFYASFINVGFLWANITLIVLTLSYLIFYLATYDIKEKSFKTKKKVIKHIFKGIKLAVTGMTLGITIYGIYIASTHVNILSVILSCFMALFWVGQLTIEVLTYFLEYQIALFIAAIEADKDEILKPITAVGNLVKKVTGKETDEPKEPSKILKTLEEKAQEIRQNGFNKFFGRFFGKKTNENPQTTDNSEEKSEETVNN